MKWRSRCYLIVVTSIVLILLIILIVWIVEDLKKDE